MHPRRPIIRQHTQPTITDCVLITGSGEKWNLNHNHMCWQVYSPCKCCCAHEDLQTKVGKETSINCLHLSDMLTTREKISSYTHSKAQPQRDNRQRQQNANNMVHSNSQQSNNLAHLEKSLREESLSEIPIWSQHACMMHTKPWFKELTQLPISGLWNLLLQIMLQTDNRPHFLWEIPTSPKIAQAYFSCAFHGLTMETGKTDLHHSILWHICEIIEMPLLSIPLSNFHLQKHKVYCFKPSSATL